MLCQCEDLDKHVDMLTSCMCQETLKFNQSEVYSVTRPLQCEANGQGPRLKTQEVIRF